MGFVDSYKLNPSFEAVAPTLNPQSGLFVCGVKYYVCSLGSCLSNFPITEASKDIVEQQ
jgi:hypothetical protein